MADFSYKKDQSIFFDSIRDSVFHGKLSQPQVEGINSILAAFDGYDIRQVAYVLATTYHETGHTMQPVEEYGKGKGRPYGSKIKQNGQPYTTPDHIYYGRGHTQNTWYENYQMLTHANKNGWDFLNNPDLLLQDEPSVWATKYAMTNGSYTGKKLSDFFNDTRTDPIGARTIINGHDQAALITTYYYGFIKALGA